jgi:hypothetical protein
VFHPAADAGPGLTKLVDGPGYSLVYSADADIGIDARPSVTVTFADGGLDSYQASDQERLAINKATDWNAEGDNQSAWGTWMNGPTTGVFYTQKPGGDFTWTSPNEGFHYAIARATPDAALPKSGTMTWDKTIGASHPTRENAKDMGTFGQASVTCDFGTSTCTITLTTNMPDGAASISAEPATVNNGNRLQSQTGQVVALLSGDNGERLIVAYAIDQLASTTRGTVVLGK